MPRDAIELDAEPTPPDAARQAAARRAAELRRLAGLLADDGHDRAFADAFRTAYLLSPTTEAMMDFFKGETREAAARRLHQRARTLIDHGVAFAPVIAALAIGEAILGRPDQVRRLVDYPRYFRRKVIAPPDGADPGVFHAALAQAIRSNLRYYGDSRRKAITSAWRHNHLTESSLPACQALTRLVRAEVDAYVAALPADPEAPFLAARPASYFVRGWGVVTRGDGHHLPHYHPRAWMSGVYYVVQPPCAADADARRGWLHVGPPGALGVTTGSGWDERHIAPEPGTLVLMPAYFQHGTRPTGLDQERICVAFDVVPAELDRLSADETEHDGVGLNRLSAESCTRFKSLEPIQGSREPIRL